MMLGKQPARYDENLLRLENYLDLPKLPPLPETSNWFAKASRFPMDGNDQYGDCVVAGAAHLLQVWSANAGKEVILSEKQVVDAYFEQTGGGDDGLNMLDFLKTWRKTGLAGRKIAAYAAIDPKNLTSLRYANYLFGGVYMGFMLPLSAQKQKTWDVPAWGVNGDGAVGSWGGHCVNCGIATPRLIQVATWGAVQWATVRFVGTYCDEAYALIGLEWFDGSKKAPNGFYLKDLQADLAAVTKK